MAAKNVSRHCVPLTFVINQIPAPHFAGSNLKSDAAFREMSASCDITVALCKFDFIFLGDLSYNRKGLDGPCVGIVGVAETDQVVWNVKDGTEFSGSIRVEPDVAVLQFPNCLPADSNSAA